VDPIVPLFAHNRRLWLRFWAATQTAALVAAAALAGFSARAVAVFAVLIAYHAFGVFAHRWMLLRPRVVLLYVPLGWLVVVAAISVHPAFALLVFGVVIQAFLFLSFTWAALALGAATLLLLVPTFTRVQREVPRVFLTQVGAILALGITSGAVLFYIHTANREAAVRADLLRRLGVLAERERLSRDIHDTLAQAFASVLRHLEAIELDLGRLDTVAASTLQDHLSRAQSVSRESMAEIRRVVRALRPAELTDATLSSAIERIVARWGDANHVRTDVSVTAVPPLHPEADVIFLRATQESLSNVARHAGARQVRVTLGCVEELVLLTVEDDGRGFDEDEARSGEQRGLSGMRERVRQFSGHVLIETAPGVGTSLTVAMPLTAITSSTP
jgi:signal transduction histidine kinase